MQFEKCFTPALTCFLFAVLSCSPGVSQEDPNEDVAYKPYLELVSYEYAAAPKGGKQSLKLKLNFSADLPLGTKIQMDLVHNGLPLIGETIFFDFKTAKRKGFIYEWTPKKTLGVDNYYLRVQVDLLNQVAKVRKEFATKAKIFPPKANPLVWLYGQEQYAIKVGTDAELQAQQEMMLARMLRFGGGDIEVEVRGHDLDQADKLAERVSELMKQVPGLININVIIETIF